MANNRWINHVEQFSKTHNMKYKEAMIQSDCEAQYKTGSGFNIIKKIRETASIFNKCYNSYAFDSEKCSDLIMDNQQKQFQVDCQAALVYDFLLIVTFQCEMYINHVSGTATFQPLNSTNKSLLLT